ncbi:hypothetical protein MUK42_13930 [Musa troglodytarum]|uniref:Uncharacterized protein n=1 Tax=Musa troglodytarum TaxID=320322 RepID=A0A9E7KVR4_9LILI|nr:hypothetical protein MUK42_13930 [Musa troglodytarum]
MMALMPVNCWNTCISTAMTSCGRLCRFITVRNGCFTCRAISQARAISWNSSSTFSVPLIFLSMARPASVCSRSMRLVGVSVMRKEPKHRIVAGTPARPRDSRHPHGWRFEAK